MRGGPAPSNRELSDAWLTQRIREIHRPPRRLWRAEGARRTAHGPRCPRRAQARRAADAPSRHFGPGAQKRGRTTIRVPGVRVADDLVERDFAPAAPNVLWVADITYLRTWEGWLYLVAVQDAFSRRSSAGRWPTTCAPTSSSTH